MNRRSAIGIAIDQAHIRVACVRGDRVEWVLEAEIDDPLDPCATLEELLAQAPVSDSRRTAVGLAITRPLAQLRVVEGLPDSIDEDLATSLVGESPHRWFLTRAGGLTTSTVATASDGTRIAAAYPRSVLDSIRLKLDARGLRPRFVTIGSVAQCAQGDVAHFDVGGAETSFAWDRAQLGTPLLRPGDGPRDSAHGSPEGRFIVGSEEQSIEFAAAIGAAALAVSDATVPFSVASFAQNPPMGF